MNPTFFQSWVNAEWKLKELRDQAREHDLARQAATPAFPHPPRSPQPQKPQPVSRRRPA